MSLSKKDYEVFAKILGTSSSLEEQNRRIIDYFEQENSKFDRVRFEDTQARWGIKMIKGDEQ